MRILYVAELVGKAGIYALKQSLQSIKKERNINVTVVCADAATGGNGLGRHHAGYIKKLGADLITTGDCCFFKKDLVESWVPYVIRPANLGSGCSSGKADVNDKDQVPGFGWRVFNIPGTETKAAAAVLLGTNFTRIKADNPFTKLNSLLEKLRTQTSLIVIDFHAWASGEKRTLFAAAAGRCTAVIGSHNRVQTADEEILDGTAVICDAGRTGSTESVGGANIDGRILEYRTGIPDWTREACDKCELQGLIIEADDLGRALSIERIRVPVPDKSGS
ncbi:MAG: YmdB family metallophosphoesterase [Treponema sp.]|nr:YmdB family metallophosphoesterase [Treponema sp.]